MLVTLDVKDRLKVTEETYEARSSAGAEERFELVEGRLEVHRGSGQRLVLELLAGAAGKAP